VTDKTGFTAVTTQQIWPDHPEKVFATTAEFADANPRTVKAMLRSSRPASAIDKMDNWPHVAEAAARPYQHAARGDPRAPARALRLRRRPHRRRSAVKDVLRPRHQLP
jgi:ABC-type nitrate/sulfonate/bicarbonate transport system substrate-binding protein